MRILVVEDDQKFSFYLKTGLESDGHRVDLVYDSIAGERKVMSKNYDVIILDVILPGEDGFVLLEKIRKNEINTPVMMLTSLDSIEDKVRGFECGADDYLVKPFSYKELQVRVKALKRRFTGKTISHMIRISDLELDTQTKKARRSNRSIKLTAIEYKLLEFLAKNKGRVLDRLEIMDHIWGSSYNSGTNVVDVHINSIRKKIDKEFSPKLIRTVIGMGYVMDDEESDT